MTTVRDECITFGVALRNRTRRLPVKKKALTCQGLTPFLLDEYGCFAVEGLTPLCWMNMGVLSWRGRHLFWMNMVVSPLKGCRLCWYVRQA